MSRTTMRLIAFYAALSPVFILGVDLLTSAAIRNIPYAASAVVYWSHAPAVIGLDHGVKGLAALFFGAIAYWLWRWTGQRDSALAHLGLIAGILFGLVLGISLDLQGMTMAFAARGLANAPHLRAVYSILGDWAMGGGGLSVSLYAVADLFLAVWLLNAGSLLRGAGHKWLATMAWILAVSVAGATLTDWTTLVLYGSDASTHMLQQNAEFLTQLWVAAVAIRWLTSSQRAIEDHGA